MSARDVIGNLRALAARTSDAQGAQRVAWGPVWRDARRWLDDVFDLEHAIEAFLRLVDKTIASVANW